MDRNTLLALTLSMGVVTLYLMYQAETRPPGGIEQPATGIVEAVEPPAGSKALEQAEAAPAPEALNEKTATASQAPVPAPTPAPEVPAAEQIEEWTRVFERGDYVAVVTNRGAGLTSWKLTDPKYDERIDGTSRPIQMLQLEEGRIAFTTPFEELGLGDLSKAMFSVESSGPDGVSFLLERGGVQLRKKYHFDPSGYGFELALELRNDSQRVLQPRFEVLWPAVANPASDFQTQSLAMLQAGNVKREPISGVGVPGFFGSTFGGRGEEPFEFTGDIGWAGIDTTYFIGALAPERTRSAQVRFEPLVKSKVGAVVLGFEPLDLPSGQSLEQRMRGFMGPKVPELLDVFGSDLVRSIDRGYQWLTPLTSFFQWLLTVFYSVIPNYGWAIVLVTILVRLVTAPIMMRQMRSMERMREVQPQLKELQEKYKDDRQKQSEAMMALYKREGVNPLGGCLPMLLQFPVFIGLFYALKSSIELRHAPFMLWINDLSSPESLFMIPGIDLPVRVLPIVMGASMVLQQRMTPMTMDPAQARMMTTVMPIMMTVLFYRFPSGLVLYWMISNFLGIGHQLWVGKRMRASTPGAAGAAVAKAAIESGSEGGNGKAEGQPANSNPNRKRGKKTKRKQNDQGEISEGERLVGEAD